MRSADVLALAFVLLPAVATAQTMFVQGGYGVESRRFSSGETERVLDANTGVLSVGAGGFLGHRFTAGFELDLGAESQNAQTFTLTIAGRPETLTTTYKSRQRSASALAGFHTGDTPRVRLGVYGGLAFVACRREVSSDAPPLVLSSPQAPTVFSDRTVAPAVGADVAVSVTRAAAIVASVRAHGMRLADLDGFAVRTAAMLRVSF